MRWQGQQVAAGHSVARLAGCNEVTQQQWKPLLPKFYTLRMELVSGGRPLKTAFISTHRTDPVHQFRWYKGGSGEAIEFAEI